MKTTNEQKAYNNDKTAVKANNNSGHKKVPKHNEDKNNRTEKDLEPDAEDFGGLQGAENFRRNLGCGG